MHLPEVYARFTVSAGESLGSGGSGGRDFDADGHADLVIAVERAVNGGVWITHGPVAGATELTDTEAAWAHGDLRAEGAGSAVVMGDVSYGAVSPAMLFMITGRGM